VRVDLALPSVPATRPGLATSDVLAPRDILYGFMAHTFVCVVIAAVEGLMGR
jgi:hypothetical protein